MNADDHVESPGRAGRRRGLLISIVLLLMRTVARATAVTWNAVTASTSASWSAIMASITGTVPGVTGGIASAEGAGVGAAEGVGAASVGCAPLVAVAIAAIALIVAILVAIWAYNTYYRGPGETANPAATQAATSARASSATGETPNSSFSGFGSADHSANSSNQSQVESVVPHSSDIGRATVPQGHTSDVSSSSTVPGGFDQAALQRERMQAVLDGNTARYNALVQEHLRLYALHGIDPCSSGFFPQSCSGAGEDNQELESNANLRAAPVTHSSVSTPANPPPDDERDRPNKSEQEVKSIVDKAKNAKGNDGSIATSREVAEKAAQEFLGENSRPIVDRTGKVVGRISIDGQRVIRYTSADKPDPYINLENKATGGNYHVRWMR